MRFGLVSHKPVARVLVISRRDLSPRLGGGDHFLAAKRPLLNLPAQHWRGLSGHAQIGQPAVLASHRAEFFLRCGSAGNANSPPLSFAPISSRGCFEISRNGLTGPVRTAILHPLLRGTSVATRQGLSSFTYLVVLALGIKRCTGDPSGSTRGRATKALWFARS